MDSHACRVAVISPVDVVKAGLTSILETDPDRAKVVEVAVGFGESDPDVVLFDVYGLHAGDGTDLEQLVKETTSAVLAVTRELRPDLGARALALGADAFVPLELAQSALLDAVLAACHGEPVDAGGSLTGFDEREHVLGHDVGLTHREVDVLSLITRGFSNQEIAQQTYLSINSVKTYIRTAYRRIGVNSRSQAVVWCLQHGFSADDPAEHA